MKKVLIISTIATLLISFSGCNKLSEDVKSSYDNVLKETETVKANIIQTREKVTETAKEIEEAAIAVKKAADALGEITK